MAEKANAISKQFFQEEDDVDRLLLFLSILSFMTFFFQTNAHTAAAAAISHEP